MSVGRNLFLGREPTKMTGFVRRLDGEYMRSKTKALLQERVGLGREIDPESRVDALSGGERQSIAIARAMFFEAELIILDERTNNLGLVETKGVLDFIRSARAAGHSSIFITHNTHHIFQVAGRIVVLRRGKKVGDVRRDETSVEEIEALITGTERLAESDGREAIGRKATTEAPREGSVEKGPP